MMTAQQPDKSELREELNDLMYLYKQAENDEVRNDAIARLEAFIHKREAEARVEEIQLIIGTHNNDPSTTQYEVISVSREVLNRRMDYLTKSRAKLADIEEGE